MQQWSCWHGVAKGPGDEAVGLGAYLVLLSGRQQASHSLPRNQTPAQGPSSSPPSVGLEGWLGSSPAEGHQMGLLVSCDCGQSTHKRDKASVYEFQVTAPSLVAKPILCWGESREDVGRCTAMLFPWARQATSTSGLCTGYSLPWNPCAADKCVAHSHLSQVCA